MSEILVAYYSWTETTATVGQEIAAALGADLLRIREAQPRRKGLLGHVRAVADALRGAGRAIAPIDTDISRYDIVALGAPVWAGRPAPAMQTFILQQRHLFQRVALFCTLGGANGGPALARMAEVCGRQAEATLLVNAAAFRTGAWRADAEAFAQTLHRRVVEGRLAAVGRGSVTPFAR